MGQIHIDDDAEFESTDNTGEKTTITLKGGRNHPASKLIDLGNGLYDIVLSSGITCLLYTSPSPRDRTRSRMPSSA